MSAATADVALSRRSLHSQVRHSFPVAADSRIFGGTFVGRNGTAARALVAGDAFLGIAPNLADNRDGAAAAINVQLEDNLQIGVTSVTGATAATAPRTLVYAEDDQTLTLTAQGNSLVGALIEVAEGIYWVHIFSQDQLAAAL